MSIQYIEPLSQGFERMKQALFKPFDLKKWFVIGFTAFLSGFSSCNSSGGFNFSDRREINRTGIGKTDWESILYFPQTAWEWLRNHPVWAMVIIIGIVIAGFCTCCCGFLLLMIPYISAVVFLPFTYTIRAFSVEFLQQFGPEFHIFPELEIVAENVPPIVT